MKEPFDIVPSPAVSGSSSYSVPRHGAPVDLRLDGNEGAAPPQALLDELAKQGGELLRRYPDAGELEGRISEMIGVAPSRVIVTAGGDDAIYRALKSVLAPGREMILPEPTFEMFERYARLAGGELVRIPWSKGSFPVDEVIASVGERTAAIAVVSPNNPTGLAATVSDLRRISEAAPRALIVVDLAYTEFADRDLTEAALGLPNAVAIRTFSKAWGLAGLRVGWAAGPERVISWMRAAGNPYAVSSASLALAMRRLDGRDEVAGFVARVRSEVALLSSLVKELGGEALPSQANFVLARFPDAIFVRDGLAGLGIAVRAFPGREGLEDCVRITVPGDENDFARLSLALRTVLEPEAVLFDIDDTLADVTESYRRATVETAARFGVEVGFEDIARLKEAGGANNDWELTWRLVREGGASASLEEVTEAFEEIYQGTAERAGLRKSERLLIDAEMLRRIARRYRLGIVTGRPRSDAATFFEEQGIAGLFGAIVTMDDAPLKPSPEPVARAMSELGVARAWMVGDTPDDVRAARGAGVLPIGVVAPADETEFARRMLANSGAARVLLKLSQIEEMLP